MKANIPASPADDSETAIGRPAITAAGLAWLWSGVALFGAGWWRFDGALIWLGMTALVTLALARWWSRRNLSGLRVWRDRPARVFVGELFEWTMTAARHDSGRDWLPGALAVEIRDRHLSRQSGGAWVAGLRRNERALVRQRARIHKRGHDHQSEFEAVSRFPLGLFETRATGRFLGQSGADPALLVCPQPHLTPSMGVELERARFEHSFPHGIDPGPGEEFRGVREYRGGDPVKAVHWGATARAGRLMVREWDPPAPRPARFGLLIHTLEAGGQSARLRRPENWEFVLRLTAGLAAHCRESETPLLFAAAVDGTRTEWLEIPGKHGYGAVFDWAALANRGGAATEQAVIAALKTLSSACDRVVVLSDVPVAWWAAHLARQCPETSLICCDSQTVTRARRKTIRHPREVDPS